MTDNANGDDVRDTASASGTRVTAPEHYWGHEVAALTLDDEMESIELGDRVLYEFTLEGMAAIYSDEWARIRAMEVVLHHRLREHQRVPVESDAEATARRVVEEGDGFGVA